jgi:LPXTG-motif cell wall-anchored protein
MVSGSIRGTFPRNGTIMMNFRRRTLVVSAAILATGGLLAVSAPASATDFDTAPNRVIVGADTTLGHLWSIAVTGDGTIYASSRSISSILVFAPGAIGDSAPESSISGANTTLDDPDGITFDSSGDLWVADQHKGILEFAPDATGNATPIRTISGPDTALDDPKDVAIGSDGTVYVTNFLSSTVTVYAPDATGNATPLTTIVGPHTKFDTLWPYGVTLSSSGAIIVSDENDAIQTFAAGAEGDATPLSTISGPDTQLDEPFLVKTDTSGNLWAANYTGQSVTEYLAGSSGDAAPQTRIVGPASTLDGPFAIAFDSHDNLYVGNYDASPESLVEFGPGVTSVSPASGSPAGGQTVVLHGYGLAGTATVTFGGVAATDVQVTSPTTITAVVPPHAVGSVDVVATVNGIAFTLSNGYAYAAQLPTTGVDPTAGTALGVLLLAIGTVAIVARRRRPSTSSGS